MRWNVMAVLLLVAAPISMAHAERHGAWSARIQGDEINLSLNEGSNHTQTHFPLRDWTGLESLHAERARIALKREPGTLTLEGHFDGNDGAGTFQFAPDAAFGRALESRGVQLRPGGAWDLFLFDVSTAQIDALAKAGYPHLTLDELTQAAIFHVTPQWIAALGDAGFRNLTFHQLVQGRIFHVDPARLATFRSLTRDATFDQLVQFQIFHITPEWIRGFEPLGYRQLTPQTLVAWKIHGVTPEFISSLEKDGQKPSPHEVVQRRLWAHP